MITRLKDAELVYTEVPVVFAGAGTELFGIVTAPAGSERGIGVVLLPGGSYIASPNRNRLSVRLARRLAADGFHVLRFDYHGVGESGGSIEGYALTRPFTDDLEAAVRWMREIGLSRFALAGSCFGARTIMAAAERIEGLEAAVLISTPLEDSELGDARPTRYARELSIWQLLRKAARLRTILNLVVPRTRENRLRGRRLAGRTAAIKGRQIMDRLRGGGRSASWVSPSFVRELAYLAEHKIPTLLLFGEAEDFYTDFTAARGRELRAILPRAARIDVQTVPGVVHGFTSLRVQSETEERTARWLLEVLA